MNTYDMRAICKICGASYGEHRHIDAACPDDMCETRDYKGGWLKTTFVESGASRKILCPVCGQMVSLFNDSRDDRISAHRVLSFLNELSEECPASMTFVARES